MRQFAEQAGCSPVATNRLARSLGEEEGLCERLVQELVATGACRLGAEGPQVFLTQLSGVDSRGLAFAADLRLTQPLDERELFHLSQLYAALGLPERAATALRELWNRMELPLEHTLHLGRRAAAASGLEVALAAVDRVAETILTRDPDASDGHDLLRESPHQAAVLLGAARDVALTAGDPYRAASLARAASALWGRLEQPALRWAAIAKQAQVLVAANQHTKARQVLGRWRDEAQEQGDVAAEARAVRANAEWIAEEGKLGHAASLLADAVELFDAAGEEVQSLDSRLRQGEFLALEGSWDGALKTFALARDVAVANEDELRLATLWVSEGECALELGRFSHAMRCAESGRENASPETLARSTLLVAGVLTAAGDGKRAQKALLRLIDEGPAVQARSLELRAELALGRGDEAGARLALADAARLHGTTARTRWASCLVTQAELALLQGDADACRALCEKADTVDAPALDLRHELLQARLGDPEEAELLLEDLVERTSEEGNPLDHLRALYTHLGFAVANDGDVEATLERLGGALSELRDALPEAFRKRFATSPWVGRLRGFASHEACRAQVKATVERFAKKG